MENDSTKLLIALEDFISNHPTSTTIDIQNFIIGWNKAVEVLSLNDNSNKILTFRDAEKIFLKFFDNFDYTVLKYIYCNYNKECFIKINHIDNIAIISHIFWDKFEKENNLNYHQTREFLKSMCSKHLFLKNYKIVKQYTNINYCEDNITNDETLFLELLSNLKRVSKTYWDVWYNKDDNEIIRRDISNNGQDFTNPVVNCSIAYFCSKFELYYKNETYFKLFLNNMLKTYLNIKDFEIRFR